MSGHGGAGIAAGAGTWSSKPGPAVDAGPDVLPPPAGLFNLRGDDIPYNPVFYSYTLLTSTNIRWAAPPRGDGSCPDPSLPFFPPTL